MAKTGGSLFGKADPTLVQMAYHESMANVPLDMKDIYKLEAETNTMMWEAIQKGFDEVFADTIALNEEFEAVVDDVMAEFTGGTAHDRKMMEMYDFELKDLKERIKGEKEGSLEERELYNELERLRNSTDKYGETLLNIGTFVKNNEHNIGATGKNIPLLKSIFDKTAKKKIENGNFYFSETGDEGTWKDWNQVQKMMIAKDHANESDLLRKLTGEAKYYKNNPKAVYDEDARQGNINYVYNNNFKTREAYADLIYKNVGNMKYSLIEAINGKDPKMRAAIEESLAGINTSSLVKKGLDVSGPGGVPDGKITSEDFKNEANAKKLITALTDITDETFDFETAKQFAAEFYTDNLFPKAIERAVKNRTGKTDTGFTGQTAEKQKQQMQNYKTAMQGDIGKTQPFYLNKDMRFDITPTKDGVSIIAVTDEGKKPMSAQSMLDLMFKSPGLYDAAKIFKGINFVDVPDIDDLNPVIYTKLNGEEVRYNDFESIGGEWYYPGGEKKVGRRGGNKRAKKILDKLNRIYK